MVSRPACCATILHRPSDRSSRTAGKARQADKFSFRADGLNYRRTTAVVIGAAMKMKISAPLGLGKLVKLLGAASVTTAGVTSECRENCRPATPSSRAEQSSEEASRDGRRWTGHWAPVDPPNVELTGELMSARQSNRAESWGAREEGGESQNGQKRLGSEGSARALHVRLSLTGSIDRDRKMGRSRPSAG